MRFQHNQKFNCPDWIIEAAPTEHGDDVLLRSCNFKEQGIWEENALTKIPRPSEWTPSDDCETFINDEKNWVEPIQEIALESNDVDDYMTRRSIIQQKYDFLIEQCVKECFPIKNVAPAVDEIESRFKELAKRFKFTTQIWNGDLICDKGRKADKKAIHSMRTNCPCKISLSFIYSLSKERDDQKNYQKRPRYDHTKSRKALCMICKVNPQHNHSRNKAEVYRQIKRSGKISKAIPEEEIFRLMMYAKNGSKLKAEIIRTTLYPCFPDGYVLTATEINNIRIKIRRIERTISHKEMRSFDQFCEIYKSYELTNMLSDNWDYGISESSKRSQECVANLRREMRSTPGVKGSTGRDDFPPNSIVSINELWKDMDDTFDYRIDVDNEDGSIRAVCWQTGAQRNNFSRNGSYISIDACKRDYCSSGHEYVSVSMRRADGSVCLAIEALVESETIEAYAWLINQLFEMCNKDMKREHIKVVAADQFVTQKHVTERLGLPNAILIMDWWHLKNRNFPDNFERHRYSQIRSDLENLLLAQSENRFYESYRKIEKILTEMKAPPKEFNY